MLFPAGYCMNPYVKSLPRGFLIVGLLAAAAARADDQPAVAFETKSDRVLIAINEKPFAAYVFKDSRIRRPYFMHVCAPSGVQVTRNYPPVAGKDASDHAEMHPGIWMAFGNLSGADFWRNQGTVQHVEFITKPVGGPQAGAFTVRNRYAASTKAICEEAAKISIQVRPAGYLLMLDSTFTSDPGCTFGDQEEMGLGVRVATALTVKNGGQITNSAGHNNERQVWGKQADWASYRGAVAGKQVGIQLMPHPDNFRRSWFHARDYGLLVANPFGRRAFTKGEPSKLVIQKGDRLRLRFGVLIHDGAIDSPAAYADYQRTARALTPKYEMPESN